MIHFSYTFNTIIIKSVIKLHVAIQLCRIINISIQSYRAKHHCINCFLGIGLGLYTLQL